MRILVDIGGTYARFATEENGAPGRIVKYAAEEYADFAGALRAYTPDSKGAEILIATAAHPGGDVWRFLNRNKWVLDPAAIEKAGVKVRMILNDFEAATWGLVDIAPGSVSVLRPSPQPSPRGRGGSFCLIGPGTGLGLGYLRPGPSVQKTMGGHVAAAGVTDEQALVLDIIGRIKNRPGFVVYEDVVSGFGLFDLYRAVCERAAVKPGAQTIEAMLALNNDAQAKAAIRLFHEFFGLFAASATVAGDSYGGLYLTGGVLDRLREKNLFDFAQFEKFFAGSFVPSVQKALSETPVYVVTDPYLALNGLIKAANA